MRGESPRVYLSVLNVKLTSGKPVIDYIYMDGAGCSKTEYQKGIGPVRSNAICSGKMAMIAKLQAQLNARGEGQNLILNGMDTPETAELFVPTGAAGAMVSGPFAHATSYFSSLMPSAASNH